MRGQEILKRLKHLSEVQTMKDVTQLTHALFPGKHCPLMGAVLAVKGIQDAMMLIVGTDECAYYTKSMTMNDAFGGEKGRCVATILDTHDITFGSVAKVEEAFKELITEYNPSCVFVVTTCVVEIIGDDMDALVDMLTDTYGIPTYAVHTEHFKSQDHLPGIERTITACIGMMKPQPKKHTVNILGQRLGDFTATEVYGVLQEAGIPIGLMLPSNCETGDIERAPEAKVNIVVNETALPLAKKMQRQFGIPYIVFEKYVAPDLVLEAYTSLFEVLETKVPDTVYTAYEATKKIEYTAQKQLQGATYIYGNTPLVTFEANAYMASLGMIPQLLQLAYLKEEDTPFIQQLLTTQNPYVAKGANIAPLQYVYDVLQPHLYLGHEYAMRLRTKGIAIVRTDEASGMLGFELTQYLMTQLMDAYRASQAYKEAIKHGTM